MRSELLRSVMCSADFANTEIGGCLFFFCTNWRSLDYFTLSVSCVAVVVVVVVIIPFLD